MAVDSALESPLGPAACEKDAKALRFIEEMTRNADMYRHAFGIDPTGAAFAGAALPVKMPSEGPENSIEVPSCSGPACGCSPSCDCKPECHCEGPSEGSKKSIKAAAILMT